LRRVSLFAGKGRHNNPAPLKQLQHFRANNDNQLKQTRLILAPSNDDQGASIMTTLISKLSVQQPTAFSLILANFFEKRRTRLAKKQTVNALSQLDNRALKDLAICRSEIYSVAYGVSDSRRRSFAN